MPELLTADIKRLNSSLLEKVGKVCNSGVPKSETETVKKVWDMTRKVSGKNKKSECVHIKSSNGNMYYSTKEISNALGGNFQKNFQFQLQSTISGYKSGKRKRKSELSIT